MEPVALAIFSVLFTIYGSLAATDVKVLASWLGTKYFDSSEPDDPSKTRMEEAMKRLTEENFANASALLKHAMMLGLVHFTWMGAPMFAFLCFLKAVVFTVIEKGYIQMTAARAKAYLILSYSLFVPFLWAPARQELVTAYRVMMVIQCVDSKLHIPCQFLVSMAETCFHLWTYGLDGFAMPYAIIQIFAATTASTVSLVLESCLAQRLTAQFRSADAETITCGFRQVLRGICDGEVLLNGSLKIEGSSHCLNRLTATQEDLTNRCFQDLLVADEQEHIRFREFISRSQHLSDDTPACLRVSMASSCAARIGVDMYHVALPHFRGSDEIYHLLALKEDAEVQATSLPDAMPESLPVQLLPTAHGSSTLLRLRRQSRSMPAKSMHSDGFAGCMFTSMPHLFEMIVLLDPASLHHNIKQMHLNYKRSKDSQDDVMPSLRKLVRPTDWEKVRTKIAKYVDHSQRHEPVAKTMRSMWIRRLDQPDKYVQAKKVTLYFSSTGRQKKDDEKPNLGNLWLNLSGGWAAISALGTASSCVKRSAKLGTSG